MQKGKQQEDPPMYICALQRSDVTISVTPSFNAPPNGPNSPVMGRCGYYPGR